MSMMLLKLLLLKLQLTLPHLLLIIRLRPPVLTNPFDPALLYKQHRQLNKRAMGTVLI